MKTNYSPLQKLAQRIKSQEAYLITDSHSLKYFSGCETLLPEEREAYLIINPQQSFLIQSSFSPKNNHKDIKTLFGMSPALIKKHLEQITRELKLKTLYIDKNSLFVSEYENLQNIKSLEFKQLDKKIIWDLRNIKSKQEIKLVKKASQIAKKTLTKILENLKTGNTELEIKREIIKSFYELGAEAQAFPTIVAFGANSALPHHQPLNSPSTDSTSSPQAGSGSSNVSPILKPNMPVLIDCGAMYKGYRSDMTRTVWFGDKPSSDFLKIEKVIREAYDAIKTRLTVETHCNASILDQAARSVITAAGYGDKFIHTTGHGIGLEVHEPPSLNSRNSQEIKPGMVITIEPGIYLENQFGYRYENTVLVKEKGVEVLTT